MSGVRLSTKPATRAKREAVTLSEMAARITTHLKRFESDASVNVPQKAAGLTLKLKPYFVPSVEWRGHMLVYVKYADPTGSGTPLTRSEATAYLAWLDAGNVGKHWQML